MKVAGGNAGHSGVAAVGGDANRKTAKQNFIYKQLLN
jgi:hypothetical protein